ncbi:MAG: hypothetical protein WKG07_17900 [Hymenobacter sp.]
MGAHRALAAGAGRHERRPGAGQPPLRGGRALAGAQRMSVAGPAPGRGATGTPRTPASHTLARRGVWARVWAAGQQDGAPHTRLLDSTTVRAHQHASGARKNGPPALGRSRGGLTSKLHVVAGAHGRFVRGCLRAGQRPGAPQALPLLGDLAPA